MTMQTAATHGGRDTSLDGLRGIAAFCVVLSHVAAMSWNPFFEKTDPHIWQYALWHLGAPAVDVFFVLSGFVIAMSLNRNGPFTDVTRYWTARAVRLLPVAWIGVGAGLALRMITMPLPPGASAGLALRDVHVPVTDVVSYLTMVVLPSNPTIVNPVLWTTFVEVNASIAMPVFTWLSTRIREALVPLAGASLFGLAMATQSIFYVLLTPFTLGAVLAMRDPKLPLAGARVLGALSLMLLMSRHAIGEQDQMYRLVTMFGAAGLIVSIRSGVGRTMLRTAPVQTLGRISYPLYAIHYPLMAACVIVAGAGTVGITAAAIGSIGLSVALAWIIATQLDERLIRTASRIHHRRKDESRHQTA